MSIFERRFTVGWRDVDPNGHVANMVYLEYAVDTRIAFFASNGFPPNEFSRLGFGPVVKTDIIDYYRELKLLDEIRVTMENGGFSGDGSRFRVVNSIFRSSDEVAARVVTVGGWLSLNERKLIEPPEKMKDAWHTLPVSEDFQELPSSLRK